MKRSNFICIKVKAVRICLLLFLSILNFSLFIHAQGFVSRYKLPGYINHLSKSIFETSPNSYMVLGLAEDSSEATLLNVAGLNAQGQLLWTKNYGNDKFNYGQNYFS